MNAFGIIFIDDYLENKPLVRAFESVIDSNTTDFLTSYFALKKTILEEVNK